MVLKLDIKEQIKICRILPDKKQLQYFIAEIQGLTIFLPVYTLPDFAG